MTKQSKENGHAARLVAMLALALIVLTMNSAGPDRRAIIQKPSASGGNNKVEPGSGRRYALLVGCTNYNPELIFPLKGPANDVVLIRDLLIGTFAFANRDCITLCEASAKTSKNDDLRPTRANIQREFNQLITGLLQID